jgi:biopolymer transport protein ExbD
MTPLIDVVFQLLLFFILTAATMQPSLEVNLPESGLESSDDINPGLAVSIDAAGNLSINGVGVSLDETRLAFARFAAENSSAALMLMADKAASYGVVFEVLDSARSAGLVNIHLAYEQ